MGRIVDTNNKSDKYTEKRTTEFNAVETGISAVGTNLNQDV
jgi:hypothetical protein